LIGRQALAEYTEHLEELRVDILKALAKKLGIAKKATCKADVIRELGRFLVEKPKEYLGQLSEMERGVVAESVHTGGLVSYAQIQAKYDKPAPTANRWGSIDRSRHQSGESYPSRLLLVVHEERSSYRMSDPVVQILSPYVEKPPVVQVRGVTELPDTWVPKRPWGNESMEARDIRVHLGEKTALTEMAQVLRLVQAGKLKVSDKSRRPTATAVRLVGQALIGGDFDLEPPEGYSRQYGEEAGPVRAQAWPVLVQQLGWARCRKGELVLSTVGKAALDGSLAEALARAVDNFLNDEDFDELNRINHIRGQTGKGKRYLTSVAERKLPIAEAVAQWPVGEWIPLDVAYRYLVAIGNGFDVSENLMTLYLGEAQYGYLSGQKGGVNRQYLRAFLMESLATLGLVDIAYVYPHHSWPDLSDAWGTDEHSFCGRYDGLLYVRLNPLGAYCLGVTETYEPPLPAEKTLQVLPTQEIVSVGEEGLSAGDRSRLELFAVQRSDRVWGLDRDRLLDHLESGGSLDEIKQFLVAHSINDLPQTVLDFLESAARKVDAVLGVEDSILIQFKDSTDAALVARDAKAKKFCHLAGGGYLVVPKKNEQAFRTVLKRLGFILPR